MEIKFGFVMEHGDEEICEETINEMSNGKEECEEDE